MQHLQIGEPRHDLIIGLARHVTQMHPDPSNLNVDLVAERLGRPDEHHCPNACLRTKSVVYRSIGTFWHESPRRI
jgi:hypothetical protein